MHDWIFRFASPQSESHRLLSQEELDHLIKCTEQKDQIFKEEVDTKDVGILTKDQANIFLNGIQISRTSNFQSSVNKIYLSFFF